MDEKNRIYKKVKSIITQNGDKSSYIGEDDFVSLVKGGITINFHIKHPTLDIENIFRTVKRAQKIIKERLAYDLEKIDIDIYNSLDEMRTEGRSRSKYASWIAAIFDDKIRIISEKEDEEPEAVYIILTHEIIHLAIYEISKGRCPYWLDEGLAVYLSQELPHYFLKQLQKALAQDLNIPFAVLEQPLPAHNKEIVVQLAYAEASTIIEYLIETYGWDKVKSIVQQCKRRPIKAILADMSLNYYLMEQGWKRWLMGRNA